MLDSRYLDRLISKTEMTPLSKVALRTVRRAVMRGVVGDAEVGKGSWSVVVDTDAGKAVRMSFSFKRETNG